MVESSQTEDCKGSMGILSNDVKKVFDEAEERVTRKKRVYHWTPTKTKILMMTHNGDPATVIAKKLGISTTAINKHRSKQEFQDRLGRLNVRVIEKVSERKALSAYTDKAREIIQKAATTATRKLILLSKKGTPDQRIQLDACRDILDRAGLKPIEVLETRERVYTPQEVASAKAILLETEEIITRLDNKPSPFVLANNTTSKRLGSSETDKAHAGPTTQELSEIAS